MIKMKKVNIKEARSLYGKIVKEKNIENIISTFPSCICRGRCVCKVTSKPNKLYIKEIRNKYDTERYKNY